MGDNLAHALADTLLGVCRIFITTSSSLSLQELLYSHNAYLMLQNNQALLQQLLRQVWDKLLQLEENKGLSLLLFSSSLPHLFDLLSCRKGSNPHYPDDCAVVTFIQGCIFRILERHDEAEKCFLDVIDK